MPNTTPVDIQPTSEKLFVTLRNREKIVFQEEVYALSSVNEKGPFDVLPEHENFISLVYEVVTLHKKSGEKEDIKIEGGVMKVFKNKVEVYLGVSLPKPTPKS